MTSPKEFRAAFYQAVVDDDEELLPCDDELCEGGVSHQAIDYFANVAESIAEELFEELDRMSKRNSQLTLQIERLSNKPDSFRELLTVKDKKIQDLQGKLAHANAVDEAYLEGIAACLDNDSKNLNPYKSYEILCAVWNSGYEAQSFLDKLLEERDQAKRELEALRNELQSTNNR